MYLFDLLLEECWKSVPLVRCNVLIVTLIILFGFLSIEGENMKESEQQIKTGFFLTNFSKPDRNRLQVRIRVGQKFFHRDKKNKIKIFLEKYM